MISCKVDDILTFIKSRHGFVVDKEYALKYLRDFNGDPFVKSSLYETRDEVVAKADDDVEEDFYLDIPMMTSLILIPHLLRISLGEGISESSEEENNNEDVSKDILFNGKYDDFYSSEGEDKDHNDSRRLRGDIFDKVLAIILHDLQTHDDEQPPKLTKDLLREIFARYGETQVSDEILDEMIQLYYLQTDDDDDVETRHSQTLNKNSFQKALTSDLHAYDFRLERNHTFILQDILQMNESKKTKISDEKSSTAVLEINKESSTNKQEQSNEANGLKRIYVATSIDLTADSFQSENYFAILLWSLIATYFAYFQGNQYFTNKIDCDDAKFQFGCRVGVSVLDWIWIFIILSLPGSIFLYFTSGTNVDTEPRTLYLTVKQLIGIGLTTLIFVPPFFNITLIDGIIGKNSQSAFEWAPYLSFGIAIILLFVQITQLIRHLFPQSAVWTPRCTLKKEHKLKLSVIEKVRRLCDNAIVLHQYPRNETNFYMDSQVAKKKFESLETDEEYVGDFTWVYRNHSFLESREGIWVSARNVAAHASHLLALFAFIFASVLLVRFVRNEYQNAKTTHKSVLHPRSIYFNESGVYMYGATEVDRTFLAANNLTFAYDFDTDADFYIESAKDIFLKNIVSAFQLADATGTIGSNVILKLRENANDALVNATGISIDLLRSAVDIFREFQGNLVTFIYNQAQTKVTEKEVVTSIIFGAVFGTLVILMISFAYCPSIFMQIMEYRHGAFSASLVDPYFATLRKVPLNATHLFGATVWGCLISGVVTAAIFGFVLFLLIWSHTTKVATTVVATLVGILVTIILRVILVQCFFTKTFAGFYRVQPASANFMGILLESWNIALSAGEIVSRAIKLLLLTVLYLGRIDTPLLGPKSSMIGDIMIDRYPSLFTIDALLHEAHRHPYLDRLGLLCMLKIQHGNGFVTKAGSCWRLLFTLVLFPWLSSQRVQMGKVEKK